MLFEKTVDSLRASRVDPGFFGGIRVAQLISFMCFVFLRSVHNVVCVSGLFILDYCMVFCIEFRMLF